MTQTNGDKSNYHVFILHEGYSRPTENGTESNCSCTLIKGNKNIIVDTMNPWDRDYLLERLESHNVLPKDINYVVSTHGHTDHCGNNNLFLNATHIVGYTVSHKNEFYNNGLENGKSYKIDDYVQVIPTPGHQLAHVSVLVRTYDGKNVVVAGDLFENEKDIHNDEIWREAGSEDEKKQMESREKVLDIADYIIPGHGKMFCVCK